MPDERMLKLKWLDVISRDTRYSKDAYLFCARAVRQALKQRNRDRNVGGREIVETSLRAAKDEFGPMARSVLEHWGIVSPMCIGDIVFRMVEEGVLGKSADDSIDDFDLSNSMEGIFDPEKEYVLQDDKARLRN